MINLTREQAQQVLDALLDLVSNHTFWTKQAQYDKAIETLRARLAQPEPEPVAWWNGAAKFASPAEKNWDKRTGGILSAGCDTPLYTAPPQREWQKITDYEADEYWDEFVSTGCRASFGMGVDYANRVLREKNK